MCNGPVTSEESAQSTELLDFYDDFAEFQDYCAFLCDAFAQFARDDEMLDYSTAMGIERFTHWVKVRGEALKGDLKRIREVS